MVSILLSEGGIGRNGKEEILIHVCFLGGDPNVDVGPVISPQSKKRILEIVQSAVDEGATLYLDGRNATVAGYEKGNFIAPTIITDVKVRFVKCSKHYVCKYVIYQKYHRISSTVSVLTGTSSFNVL